MVAETSDVFVHDFVIISAFDSFVLIALIGRMIVYFFILFHSLVSVVSICWHFVYHSDGVLNLFA